MRFAWRIGNLRKFFPAAAKQETRPGLLTPGLVPLNRAMFSRALLPVGTLLKEAARKAAAQLSSPFSVPWHQRSSRRRRCR